VLGEQGDRSKLSDACKLGEEAFTLADKIGASREAGSVALHLGHCYCDMGGPDNIAIAERWYEEALGHVDPNDKFRRQMALFELAQIRYVRVQHALAPGSGLPRAKLDTLFNSALQAAREVEGGLSPLDADRRIRVHHLLGNIYDDAGQVFGQPKYHAEAAKHYQEFITLATHIGDAGGTVEVAALRDGIEMGAAREIRQLRFRALEHYDQVGAGVALSAQSDRARLVVDDVKRRALAFAVARSRDADAVAGRRAECVE